MATVSNLFALFLALAIGGMCQEGGNLSTNQSIGPSPLDRNVLPDPVFREPKTAGPSPVIIVQEDETTRLQSPPTTVPTSLLSASVKPGPVGTLVASKVPKISTAATGLNINAGSIQFDSPDGRSSDDLSSIQVSFPDEPKGLGQSGQSSQNVNTGNSDSNKSSRFNIDENVGSSSGLVNDVNPTLTPYRGIGSDRRLLNGKKEDSLLDFEPKGSLYVSVQQPVQVGTAPSCSFPDKFGEDRFELSTSEFGYPKSIIEQQLKDSVAEAVLKIFLGIMYQGILATQIPSRPQYNGNDLRNSRLNNRYTLRNDKLNGNGFQNFGNTNFLGNGQSGLSGSSFGSLDSSLGDSDFGKLDYFGSGLNGNSINSFGNSGLGSVNPGNVGNNFESNGGQLTRTSSLRNNEDNNFQNTGNAGSQAKGGPNFNGAKSGAKGTPTQNTIVQKENAKSLLASPRPKVPSNNNNNRQSTFTSDFQNPSFGEYDAFAGQSFLRNSPSSNTNLLGESNIDRLFPPKASGEFLDEPPGPVGDNKESPFISYSGDQRSEPAASPFNFNSQSLFGSISGSPFGLSGSGSVSSNDGNSLSSSFGESNFGSGTSLFNTDVNSKSQGNSQGNRFPNGQFGFTRSFRRKRQARGTPQTTSVTNACSPTYKVLRQYKNYSGTCFMVMPDAQGIYYAECSNSPCSGCRFEGGASRCVAEPMPMWVWSYCEEGPHAGQVMPDRVEVAVTCTCKTTTCQRPIPGR